MTALQFFLCEESLSLIPVSHSLLFRTPHDDRDESTDEKRPHDKNPCDVENPHQGVLVPSLLRAGNTAHLIASRCASSSQLAALFQARFLAATDFPTTDFPPQSFQPLTVGRQGETQL
jgi:hypothetical protein